ncbi:hypothetical protein DFH08DRAFT_832948 [Mycena albidolilacea]|uniref:Uncharacterized protein n=1 Tax=Mycena albidolilacea TaxID=1033008 RepID=A0AAD7F4X4_9AGAR|nr:hypothetical protein DFH08DRAFT_832948 [Mycena albidolilacea]
MKSTLVVLASIVGFAASQLTIITPPPPVQCQPSLLSWSGGSPPYIVSVVDTANPDPPVIQWTDLTNSSITWVATTPPGTSLLFTIKDVTGTSQNSAVVIEAQGGSTSCLSTSSSGTVSASASTSASASGSQTSKPVSTSTSVSVSKTTSTSAVVSTPPATTPSPSSTAPLSNSRSSVSVSGTPASSSPSTSTTPGAAVRQGVPGAAAAAMLGLVLAALF